MLRAKINIQLSISRPVLINHPNLSGQHARQQPVARLAEVSEAIVKRLRGHVMGSDLYIDSAEKPMNLICHCRY